MAELKSVQHMGHLVLDSLKKKPDVICQVDAATGEQETNASVLARSVRLALCLKRYGLLPGDVLAIHGRNHLDVHIPFYAAMYNGLPFVGVDVLYKYDEIKMLLKLTKPKITFSEPEKYDVLMKASTELGLNLKVVVFGDGKNSLKEFIKTYSENINDDVETLVEKFEPAVFDLDKVYAWLVSSGGTTGVLKVAAIKHTNFINKMNTMLADIFKVDGPDSLSGINKPILTLAPIQWISNLFFAFGGPVLCLTQIQTSAAPTVEHVIDIINKYRPVTAMFGPAIATGIIKHEKSCDMTCFKQLIITSSKVYSDLLCEMKKRVSNGTVLELYGQTENSGFVLGRCPDGPPGNCGVPTQHSTVKLVNPETGKEITEPYVTGEMWTKNDDTAFTEYYNDPETTAGVFSDDGWYKTGDLLYRDENNHYFFVERLKMLIKYRNYHVLPPELEEVIRTHEGVLEVAVTSIPHKEDGEHAVACVVRRPGSTISAKEIKALVADKLSETKQLRGGVVFWDSLPMTSAGKVARAKLKSLVLNALRE